MSKYSPPRKNASCPACAELCWHRVVFENKEVRHLRCESCSAIHVCSHEGGFRSTIAPLDFAELFEAGKEADLPPYQASSAFHPTDLFNHLSLGVGYVVTILSPATKMEVKFADKIRLLVCGPGSGVLAEPKPATSKSSRKK